jgi:nitrite reductase/ring-hydroxylating ferredoxin subunit
MPSFTANLVYDLQYKSDFYVHDASLIRIMLPYYHQKEFSSKEELGKLSLHGPHHDFFQNVPLNAINTWVAVSNVRAENSMYIYPERWNTRVCQGENGAARFDQDLGTPLEFELDQGDMLMFHSNHLHSSRLNTTNETRVVLSNRFTLGPPNYPQPLQPQLYFKNDCFENIEDCKGIFDNNEFLGKRKAYRKVNVINKIILKISNIFGLNMLSKNIPSEVDYSKDVRISGSLDSILEGEIRVLDKKKCVTRSDGLLIVFSRLCPHQGALLDHAVIKDGKVICPYHGAKFCLKTGQSNCTGLSPLTIKNESKSNQTF